MNHIKPGTIVSDKKHGMFFKVIADDQNFRIFTFLSTKQDCWSVLESFVNRFSDHYDVVPENNHIFGFGQWWTVESAQEQVKRVEYDIIAFLEVGRERDASNLHDAWVAFQEAIFRYRITKVSQMSNILP